MINLRHSFLKIDVISTIAKLQSWGHDDKFEILVPKIRGKDRILFDIFWK